MRTAEERAYQRNMRDEHKATLARKAELETMKMTRKQILEAIEALQFDYKFYCGSEYQDKGSLYYWLATAQIRGYTVKRDKEVLTSA